MELNCTANVCFFARLGIYFFVRYRRKLTCENMCRKPDAVVPENRWRARMVWVGLLLSIAVCE